MIAVVVCVSSSTSTGSSAAHSSMLPYVSWVSLCILPVHAGIHGSFTEQYLPPSEAGETSDYDIRSGIGSQTAPKYS